MPNVPGLTPFNEDRPQQGRRNTGRVQVQGPDIRPQRLSPNADPVSTYARPEAPPQTNSWLQLADALSTISPSLQNALQSRRETQQKEMEDLALKRIGGMSFEEAEAATKDGSMPELKNPWFNAAYMKQYGERLAARRAQEFETPI